MTSKRILITGANSGIGKAASVELAKQGHEILMLCRNKERGEKAQETIKNKSENDNVQLYLADLASMQEVKDVAEQISTDYDYLDVLVNNAGLILMDKQMSEENIEKTFAVNHLGHFFLTDLLFPLLQDAPDEARIINTSSGAHYGRSLNLEDINYEKNSYSTFGAYGRSKLANILFTHELDRRLEDSTITTYSLHPGFVGSNFGKNNGIFATVVMNLLRPFAKSSKSGAQPIIYLATEEGIEDQSGKYFVDKSWIPFSSPKIRTKKTSRNSYRPELEHGLWEKSKQLINKHFPDYVFNMDSETIKAEV